MFTKKYRWFIAILLFLAGMLNYLDRSALAVMAPLIKKELVFDDAQMGILFSVFFIGYCLFCFIGGWCADRYGPKKTYAWAAGTWSIFCGATALVTSFYQLLIVRVIFGIGEGPMGTTTNKSISNWFPKKEIGRAVGFVNAGQPLGAALAAPIVGFVGLYLGWRIAFIVIALLGLFWVLAWVTFFRDKPELSNKVSQEETDLIIAERPAADIKNSDNISNGNKNQKSIFYYILSLPVIGVAVSFFCFNYIQFFFLSWLPSYLTDYQHLDIKSMSVIGVLPWLGAAIGFILGGVITDNIYTKTNNFILSRKIVIFTGLIVAATCVLLTAYASSTFSAVSFITIACLFGYMVPQACWSLLQYIVPSVRIGSTGGFVHLLANLAGILSPSITGFLIQYGGGYQSAFILSSLIAVFGTFVLLLFIRQKSVDSLLNN